MSRADSNPFRSERVTALPFQFPNGDWAEVLARLEQLGGRGAVVGPCGSGKTTFLEEFAARLQNRGADVCFVRLNSGFRDLKPQNWGKNDALIVDGAEQLSFWQWQKLKWRARHAGIFVISTHRAGRLPLWMKTSTSPALLGSLVGELGENLSRAELERLHCAHGGNLRWAMLELYDRAAENSRAQP